MTEFFENIGKFFQRLPEDSEYFVFAISGWGFAIIAIILWIIWICLRNHSQKCFKKVSFLLEQEDVKVVKPLKDANIDLESKLFEANKKITELKKEVDITEASNANVNRISDAIIAENEKLDEENKDLIAKIDILNTELITLRQRNNELEIDVAKYTSDINELEIKLSEANAKVEEITKLARSLVQGAVEQASKSKTTKKLPTSTPKTYLEELRTKKRSELFALAKEYELSDYAKLTNEELCKKISRAHIKKEKLKNKEDK